ncbi:HdeD family acid-resistance protein [Bordetella sputigena]|uniref:HdeD family acid-resistance protein n=1 Tax=Bordetella sputigena TaxID=1416810 RepID=UPI0039EE14B8
MAHLMEQAWWILIVRGVVGILFGVVALMWPALTLLFLVALFAAYALIGGVAAVVGVWRARKARHPMGDGWMIVLLGVVAIASGIIALIWPAITALALVLIMGVNALVAGILDISVAVRLRRVIRGAWTLVLAGIVSIIFGVGVIAFPGAGALALIWLISLYAIVTGILLLAMGIQARRSRPAAYDHAAA